MSIDGLNKSLPFAHLPQPQASRPQGDAFPEGLTKERADGAAGLLPQQPPVHNPQVIAKQLSEFGQLLSSVRAGPNSSLLARLPVPLASLPLTQSQAQSFLADQTSGAAGGGMPPTDNEEIAIDMQSFMLLFQKFAQTMRNSARLERTSEMQAQVSALTSAADQMKAAAALRLTAGIAQGAMQITGGLVQVGAGLASAGMSVGSAGATMKGSNANIGSGPAGTVAGNALIAQGSRLSAGANLANAVGGASGQIAGGMGGTISAGLNYAAELKEVEKTKLEIKAKVHETAVQHANETMQAMQEIIRDVRDKLQSISQAALETNRSISRNI
jgi:hypothetical protein